MNLQLPEAKLSELVTLVRFEKVPSSRREGKELWLRLPLGMPSYTTVEATPLLAEWIEENLLMGSGSLDKDLYLEVLSYGNELRLSIRYQSLSGGRPICTVTQADLDTLCTPPAPPAAVDNKKGGKK